jgi:6-pyruvoyltetrahydropterin/6-carboxytetrahydropterin synthase
MEYLKLIQLRVVPATGAERFAEFLYNKINKFIQEETDGRVRIAKIEFYEHGKNSAIYSPEINVPYE